MEVAVLLVVSLAMTTLINSIYERLKNHLGQRRKKVTIEFNDGKQIIAIDIPEDTVSADYLLRLIESSIKSSEADTGVSIEEH